MSQQINLINPALRHKRDWLTATPLAIVSGVFLLIIIITAIWAKQRVEIRQTEADQRASILKTSQDRLAELGKTVTELKPNQQLADELTTSRTMLNLREEVMVALEGGAFSNNTGFSEYLRGFARQAPEGLWLSGFTIGSGGEEMEIRGRMLNPLALPEYIQRLNSEKAFKGRSFSTLTIQRPESAEAAKPSAPQPAAPINFVEFILTSSAPDINKSAATNIGSKSSEIMR